MQTGHKKNHTIRDIVSYFSQRDQSHCKEEGFGLLLFQRYGVLYFWCPLHVFCRTVSPNFPKWRNFRSRVGIYWTQEKKFCHWRTLAWKEKAAEWWEYFHLLSLHFLRQSICEEILCILHPIKIVARELSALCFLRDQDQFREELCLQR